MKHLKILIHFVDVNSYLKFLHDNNLYRNFYMQINTTVHYIICFYVEVTIYIPK